jgi:hypothetical protein
MIRLTRPRRRNEGPKLQNLPDLVRVVSSWQREDGGCGVVVVVAYGYAWSCALIWVEGRDCRMRTRSLQRAGWIFSIVFSRWSCYRTNPSFIWLCAFLSTIKEPQCPAQGCYMKAVGAPAALFIIDRDPLAQRWPELCSLYTHTWSLQLAVTGSCYSRGSSCIRSQ